MASTAPHAAPTPSVPSILPAHGDSIRVVPLHLPDEMAAAPATPPKLTYRGGPLLSAVEVFTVFWGRLAATTAERPADPGQRVLRLYPDQSADRSARGVQHSYLNHRHGRHTGTATITTPALRHSVTDSAIQHTLQQEIATNPGFPQPSPTHCISSTCPPA